MCICDPRVHKELQHRILVLGPILSGPVDLVASKDAGVVNLRLSYVNVINRKVGLERLVLPLGEALSFLAKTE